MVVILCILFALSLILLYKWPRRKNHLCKSQEYLGLESVPLATPCFPLKLIGHMPILFPVSEALRHGSQITNYYPNDGDICKFVGGGMEIVLLNSPQLVQTLLKSHNPGHLEKPEFCYGVMKPFIANGVLVSKHPLWYQERRILMRSQSLKSLAAYMELIHKHTRNFISQLKVVFADGGNHETIQEDISVLFLKIISEMITGADVNAEEFKTYHVNFETWKRCVTFRILMNPRGWWLLDKILFLKWNCGQAIRDMNEFAKRRIRENQEKRDSNASRKEPVTTHFRSVLDELVDAGVTDEAQIIDEINTMFFGGHETGAGLVHSFFFIMACNPEVQTLCQNEIDLLFNDPNSFTSSENLSYDAVQSLKYVERCIQETLRLYPPVFLFFRQLESPLQLDCKDKKKIELPAGTVVSVFPFGMHRKPEYFPDPDSFDPDRFLPEVAAERHPYAYLPFSAGPRCCLGIKFAMIEMKTIIAHVLRNFTISTIDSPESEVLLPLVTLTPSKNYRFKFTKRSITG